MGRLFWKFFAFIWLAQLAGAAGTGMIFWLDRQSHELSGERRSDPRPPAEFHPHPRRAPEARAAGSNAGASPGGPPAHGFHPPPMPVVVGGLLASIFCAAGLAWYFAKPIRRLRAAFNAVAEGNLTVNIGSRMGRRRDELADLGHDFDRMSQHLQALMAGQRRLLHDVSHELRSPLARLQAAIGLARQQPARLEDSLQRIERESERMNRLVGELLTLSRLEAGVGGAMERLDLGELIGDLISDARFEAAARGITVNCQNPPDFWVRANGELLHRAIENVVRNALRYSPPGGVVDLVLSSAGSGVCQVAISDQGPGVPPAELVHIFTPFFRGSAQGEGYGLGLAIARRTLAAINGTIEAENGVDRGLRVVMTMPRVD